MRGFAPERNGPTEILNRPSPGEQQEPMGRPTPRPMGGFQPYDDQRDIMAGPGYGSGDPGVTRPVSRPIPEGTDPGRRPIGPEFGRRPIGPEFGYNPNRGPRSYQPGHGNGNGGYGMRGDVRTKGVQNASMGDPMQGDPNSPDAQLRVKRRYERGMSAPAPQENQSYSGTGGGASI